MSGEASYALPVAGLLTIGDPGNKGVEAQIAALGFGQEHVPELVRMAVDPELNSAPGDSLEVWAPLHALRALKGLDASAHAADLMTLVELDEDDWFREELPEVFGHIGSAALAPLQAYLTDRSYSEWGHVLVARALGEIGQRHPELRDAVVASLSEVLRNAEQYDEMACTFAMDALVELEAADALPALRRAFELDKIDTMVRGDWGDILDQLGVDPEPDDPLIARSQRNAEKRREHMFPSGLRRRLDEALGIEPEAPFVQLMRDGAASPASHMTPITSEATRQQAEDKTRKERQRRAEAQARKEKQKRKAASSARKANRKKK
jgi:hypothetical protein